MTEAPLSNSSSIKKDKQSNDGDIASSADAPQQHQHKKASKEDLEEFNLRSYTYPDKAPNLSEVHVGYETWRTDKRPIVFLLIPVCLVLLSAYFKINYSHFQEFIQLVRKQIPDQEREFWIAISGFASGCLAFIFIVSIYFITRARPVYLVDFALFQPPDSLKVTTERYMKQIKRLSNFTEESLAFQERLLQRSGLGQETYFPPGILAEPPDLTMAQARNEADMVFTGCLNELFERTGLKPQNIDILIVNCSLFNPTPSLSEMIINKYKLRSNVKNYNLSGMGCSAGVLAVELARDLLQTHRNCNAVIVSTENITQNCYFGNDKSMLISNTLFRVGGVALLLSNKPVDRWRAKYRLECLVRVHKGASDKAYHAVFQREDDDGKKGVSLSRDLMEVAGDALKSNLTILGPMVLPWSEQLKFFASVIRRKIESMQGKTKRSPQYVPNFKKAFQHFCIHAGGRAIIDGMEQNLKLEPHHVEPSRATLYRYGNTSSSSIWYELQFIERSGRMRKGHKVIQVALGSGFMCNSAVWIRNKA